MSVTTQARPEAPPEPPPSDARFVIPGVALLILAALLLGFAGNLLLVGHLQHARAQQTGYAELREQLAFGTAPVGRTDIDGEVLSPGTPVALLRIGAIGLREVVFEGTTSDVLMSGPGHRRDTVLPGQAGTSVVMGRQWGYGSPFLHLDELGPGDTIEITTGQGEHTYRVTGLRRPGDPVPEPAGTGQGRLTLITATGGPYTPSGVLRVDAELTTDVFPTPARVIPTGAVGEAEDALKGDDSAWTPTLLWSQALLLAAAGVAWAHRRWGRWQAWITGVPVLGAITVALSGTLTRLLPNLL
ncbi:sortase [Streptomyces litchfieldiae]|uniref:Class E sortase n=1 Tax=Streptomyces litchfieldiae TaxID=3075543 RepID=A0ABU2N045_9ACTN|nr:class E sortase [Streptomyces sp. DSM 44938]MDT0347271.1 class E sortase [Streptomyces sp. DSM 44938]